MRQVITTIFEKYFWEQGRITLKKYLAGLLLAIFSGILAGLSFPTSDFFPLAWIAITPMILLSFRISPLRAWGYGFFSGLSFWLTIAYWMHTFHPFSLFSAIPALALYYSLPFLASNLWRKRLPRFSNLSPVVFITVWIAVEFFRSRGFLAFSWGVLGYSQYLFLPVIQIADITGVYGVSLLLLLVNTTAALFLQRDDTKLPSARRFAFVTAALLLLSFGYGVVRLMEKRPEGGMRIAMVQGFTDPATDWRGWYRTWRTVGKIEMLSRIAAMRPDSDVRIYRREPGIPGLQLPAIYSPPELVIWSETLMARRAMAFYRNHSRIPEKQWEKLKRSPYAGIIRRQFALGKWFRFLPSRLERAMLLTSPDRQNGKSFNSAFLIDRKGRFLDQFNKIKLVPFGEWFPYDIGFIKKILAKTIASNFTPGDRFVVFRLNGKNFSAVICFEDIFGDICRVFVLDGADFLINTTNDYWSRSLKSQIQHFAISIFRAVENRRYLVRAANTGVTAIVDAWGRVISSLENNIIGVLQGEVPLLKNRGLSFYTKFGDVFGTFVLVVALAVSLLLFTTLTPLKQFYRISEK